MKLTEILKIEATNRRHIYLYHPKSMLWNCYGHSALLLHRIYPNIPYWEKDVLGNGNAVPVMIIDPLTFADLMEKLPPVQREEGRVVLEWLPEEFCQ